MFDADEQRVLVDLLLCDLSEIYETLKDDHDTKEDAMAAYDACPAVRALKKIAPTEEAILRRITEENITLYLD